MKDIYELYDPELTGKIPQDDYATIVRGMGHNPSEKQLQEMFQETRSDPTWANYTLHLYVLNWHKLF